MASSPTKHLDFLSLRYDESEHLILHNNSSIEPESKSFYQVNISDRETY